ncbi:MAG: hypothetical protein K6U14_06365 [Firmicutes bacterium]|nr:hypothetical protein [Alicyclobacillaceae bacterium]MCL6497243.1 hypothetical protein [Bacillota bacterium]
MRWGPSRIARIRWLGMWMGAIGWAFGGWLGFGTPCPTVAAAQVQAATWVSRDTFGVNVGTWDQQLAQPSTIGALQRLGIGWEQFPNPGGVYNWMTNQALGPNGQWSPQPVSLTRWGHILSATGEQGLYLVPYGFNPTGTAGEPVSDVVQLTRFVVAHHLPITAMVIGAEEYLGGTINLHRDRSPEHYAKLAAQMAQAIHAVDPAMAVGVDVDVPLNPSLPNPVAEAWNRAVLTTTAPYVQFVSIHVYPVPEIVSNVDLLQALHSYIRADMAYVRAALNRYARGFPLAVWVTEFNPYNGASVQSVEPIFAAAATEGLLLWAHFGAQRVFWWSLHGDANPPLPLGSPVQATGLETNPHAPFGTFGLLSEAIPPQPAPLNTPYPAGQAIAQLMGWVGQGAQLVLAPWYPTAHVLGFEIARPGKDTWVVINAAHAPRTVTVGSERHTLAPGSLWVVQNPPVAPTLATGFRPSLPPPAITAATFDVATGTLTITGSHFGAEPPVQSAPSGGVDQARLLVEDTANGAHYGWTAPGEIDWYGVDIRSWTDRRIVLAFPSSPPAPDTPLTVSFWHRVAGQALREAEAPVATRWLGGATSPPRIDSARFLDPVTLAVSGSDFGPPPPTVPATQGGVDQAWLRIDDAKTGAHYGWRSASEVDAYGITLVQWTPDRIVVRFAASPPAPGDPLRVEFPDTGAPMFPLVMPGRAVGGG